MWEDFKSIITLKNTTDLLKIAFIYHIVMKASPFTFPARSSPPPNPVYAIISLSRK